MASAFPGFEYDIFISYRQNDNRSGWVTEFVSRLEAELSATIKEPISVYFDFNPHDGLLEPYNVDKSLKGKLKSVIFIPIVSQTYCDPKSFAWQHEFLAFLEAMKEDPFGRDIKLANGNVMSRILPIKIHDLDLEDKALLENEFGGVLRAIEFIYKCAGVNRPLTTLDNPEKNHNNTFYHDQINKVANAVKEMVQALKHHGKQSSTTLPVAALMQEKPSHESSIVVLPFVNMSNDPEQEYFCDGITEEIINSLSILRNLRVIARTSSFSFKGKSVNASEIGNKLDVDFLLEGSVRKSQNKLRVTTTLIKTDDHSHLWSAKYDKELADIFVIQDEITSSVMDRLKILFSADSSVSKQKHSASLDAYDFFLLGKFYWGKGSLDAELKCIEHFEKALEIDPAYSLAHAWLALTYWWYRFFGFGPPEIALKIEKHSKKALSLSDKIAEAHTALALLELYNNWNWRNAELEFQKALDIDPRSVITLLQFGNFHANMGQGVKAIAYLEQALQVDPLNSAVHQCLGWCFYANQQFEKAVQQLRKALDLDSENIGAHIVLVFTLMDSGDLESAEYHLTTVKTKNVFLESCLARLFCMKHDNKSAEEINIRIQKENSFVPPIFLAWIQIGLGNYDNAFKYLDESINQRDYLLISMPIFKWWDPIRSDPRFNKALDKMGLVDYLK
ncbi:MAG: hypothetical protein OEV74_21870 [Cyclobacteriaceae bacterium]|nr:hypothetical protein [Cyclobacteriaceae bacterium]MDH4298933.1 hypothetical protein [Cyclobacteriaceae bacterium]MDH5251652.1 hypothetical protein [Cyclobacteriaceae bacterium]